MFDESAIQLYLIEVGSNLGPIANYSIGRRSIYGQEKKNNILVVRRLLVYKKISGEKCVMDTINNMNFKIETYYTIKHKNTQDK